MKKSFLTSFQTEFLKTPLCNISFIWYWDFPLQSTRKHVNWYLELPPCNKDKEMNFHKFMQMTARIFNRQPSYSWRRIISSSCKDMMMRNLKGMMTPTFTGISVSFLLVLSLHRYLPPKADSFEELERKYWKNVSFRKPIYGADVPGSLTHPSVKVGL